MDTNSRDIPYAETSTAIAKASLARFLEQRKENEISEADTMMIVNLMGGIERILEDYLSPENHSLTADQINTLDAYIRTPVKLISSKSQTAMPSDDNKLDDEHKGMREGIDDNLNVITVGDTVSVDASDSLEMFKFNAFGIVRFIGNVQSKSGVFYGIELKDDKYGRNRGSYGGVSYFKTRNNSKCGVFTTKKRIHKIKENSDPSIPRVSVGYKVNVQLKRNKCIGIIRFIGDINHKKGKIYFGVELVSACGLNDGCLGGRSYFKCKDNYGVFVTGSRITSLYQFIGSNAMVSAGLQERNNGVEV